MLFGVGATLRGGRQTRPGREWLRAELLAERGPAVDLVVVPALPLLAEQLVEVAGWGSGGRLQLAALPWAQLAAVVHAAEQQGIVPGLGVLGQEPGPAATSFELVQWIVGDPQHRL